MTDLSPYLKCTIGGGLQFQVEEYTWHTEPIIKTNVGSVGRKLKAVFTGFVEGADLAGFASALAGGIIADSGRDIIVSGMSEVEAQILTAQCVEGGPHFTIDVDTKGGNALRRGIVCQVDAVSVLDPNNPNTMNLTVKARITTKPNTLREIVHTGLMVGPNVDLKFTTIVLPGFQKQFPKPGWIVTYNYEHTDTTTVDAQSGNQTADPPQLSQLTYTLSATELAGDMPSAGSTEAVDGEITTSVETDEQMRKTTTLELDLTIGDGGDPQALVTSLRPQETADKKIRRQSVAVTKLKEIHLRATFVIVEGGDGNALLNWEQTLELLRDDDSWEEVGYEGADPIAVQRRKTIARLVQSGSAIGSLKYPKEPPPLGQHMSDRPKITFKDISNFEKQTSWNYPLLMVEGVSNLSSLISQLGRPNPPSFY